MIYDFMRKACAKAGTMWSKTIHPYRKQEQFVRIMNRSNSKEFSNAGME
jgi:hypothetical protein